MMGKPSIKQIIISLTIFILYTLAGAAVFQQLERDTQQRLKEEYHKSLNKVMQKYNISRVDMNELEELITKSGKQSVSTNWSFSSAVFFTGSTILTVGYGHITPKTTAGQAFCLLYVIFGIPIACIALKSLGERITVAQLSLVTWLHTLIYRDRRRVESIHLKVLIFSFFVALLAILILAGLARLKRIEWSYFECIYFVVITFTTIGFGDYVPVYEDTFSEFDVISLTLGFFAGFTLVSSLLCSVSNMMEEHSTSMIRKARETIHERRVKSKDAKHEQTEMEVNRDQSPPDGVPGKFVYFSEVQNAGCVLSE